MYWPVNHNVPCVKFYHKLAQWQNLECAWIYVCNVNCSIFTHTHTRTRACVRMLTPFLARSLTVLIYFCWYTNGRETILNSLQILTCVIHQYIDICTVYIITLNLFMGKGHLMVTFYGLKHVEIHSVTNVCWSCTLVALIWKILSSVDIAKLWYCSAS